MTQKMPSIRYPNFLLTTPANQQYNSHTIRRCDDINSSLSFTVRPFITTLIYHCVGKTYKLSTVHTSFYFLFLIAFSSATIIFVVDCCKCNKESPWICITSSYKRSVDAITCLLLHWDQIRWLGSDILGMVDYICEWCSQIIRT